MTAHPYAGSTVEILNECIIPPGGKIRVGFRGTDAATITDIQSFHVRLKQLGKTCTGWKQVGEDTYLDRETVKLKAMCKFYQQGKCHKGEGCMFSHVRRLGILPWEAGLSMVSVPADAFSTVNRPITPNSHPGQLGGDLSAHPAPDISTSLKQILLELRELAARDTNCKGPTSFRQTVGIVCAAWEASFHRQSSALSWSVDSEHFLRLFVRLVHSSACQLCEDFCCRAGAPDSLTAAEMLDHVERLRIQAAMPMPTELVARTHGLMVASRGTEDECELGTVGLERSLGALQVVRDLWFELICRTPPKTFPSAIVLPRSLQTFAPPTKEGRLGVFSSFPYVTGAVNQS